METTTPGQRWPGVVASLGGDPAAAVPDGADLDLRYAEPHRIYHTATHILAVAAAVDALAGDVGLAGGPLAQVHAAALAHDVVYAGAHGEDERASADWAVSALARAGVAATTAAEVCRLILATAEHEATAADTAAAVLLDADLSILGADAAAYDGYVGQVRREYAAVPEDAWRVGRGALLAGFLARERLFVTGAAHARWDAAARVNLARELGTLQ